jgi:hypothetical protein
LCNSRETEFPYIRLRPFVDFFAFQKQARQRSTGLLASGDIISSRSLRDEVQSRILLEGSHFEGSDMLREQ